MSHPRFNWLLRPVASAAVCGGAREVEWERGRWRNGFSLTTDDHAIGPRGELQIEERHLQSTDERQNGGLSIEAATGEAKMCGIRRELVERGIHWQPQAEIELSP